MNAEILIIIEKATSIIGTNCVILRHFVYAESIGRRFESARITDRRLIYYSIYSRNLGQSRFTGYRISSKISLLENKHHISVTRGRYNPILFLSLRVVES